MFSGDHPLSLNYVIPKPFDPRVVPHVARKVAEIKGIEYEDAARITLENAKKFYRID